MTAVTGLRHRFVESTILGAPLRSMLLGQTTQVLYTDPPWNDHHSGRLQRLRWREFMGGFVQVVRRHVDGWVFVEMGVEHLDTAAEMLSDGVCKGVRAIPTNYHGNKAWLLVGHTSQDVTGWQMPPERTGGVRQVKAVVGDVARPGDILLDPCCMNVYSARAAIAHNLTFYGAATHKAAEIRAVLERG